MRNCIVHAESDAETQRRLDRSLAGLRRRLAKLYEQETDKANRFNAPNGIDRLTIDDFRLFSRCIQRVARLISDLSRPRPEMIIEAAFSGRGGKAFGQSFKKFNHMKDKSARELRQRRATQLRLMDLFGLTVSESETILDKVPLPIALRAKAPLL